MDSRHPYPIYQLRRAFSRAAMFLLAILFIAGPVRAQLMINKGATIVTKPSSFMQVNGAYQNQTGSIDDSGVVTITTDFTNNTAATSSNAGWYNIGGNFTNDGTFNRKTGTVNLYGATNQNVGGAVITTFYDLQFTGGGSKTLTQKEIVDSDCYFNNGICYTTQTDVLNFDVQGNWINISGMPVAPCASYVDGPCEKDMNSTNLFWFPVGKAGRANTCAITPASSTATTFRTQYFNFSYVNTTSVQSPIVTVSKVQYWHGDIVTPNPTGGADAKIRLYWIPGDYTMSIYMSTISNLLVARWDTLAPNPPGPTPAWVTAGVSAIMLGATYNSGWIESAVVIDTQYGLANLNRPFTIASDSTDNSLPVEMGPFTARQVENHVQLDWRTYSEIESLGFELERRLDSSSSGDHAQSANSPVLIASFMNDTALQAKSPWGASYETIDNNLPGSGRYTYDLYQIDKNGLRTHVGSQTVDFSEIAIPSALGCSVYPNPAVDKAWVDFDLPKDAPVSLDLFDVTGRNVGHFDEGQQEIGPHTTSLDLSPLPSGTYSLVVLAGDERITRNIVIMK
ncbi:MAG TPA: T9SS type A sorting domain-containing protein [Candidatus Kapabacteria bacterium]|nr:T9SS type A sorting domain-containing protein [Candidatus Kapabacteria bacterium]